MTRKHVYVNFTDRVASIRIDPIRRSQGKRNAPDASNTESLFMSSLERWDELNLATHYTQFSRQCSPIAQSLPMILYNQNKIFDLLIDSLDATDEHSVEPLLDLLVQFARDLGEDFEQFYPRALKECISIIEKNQRDDKALNTVELAFNSLAYLFKYLSRLLTPNLIPTYDILVPLFGGVKGSKWRSFVLRFAAESMGFLVRRASGESLQKIIDHIVSGVSADLDNEQYMNSSAQLLASTLKGPQSSLHSKASALLKVYYDSCHKYGTVDLLCKTLTEVLHHARQDTAGVIYEAILPKVEETHDSFACRCLFVLAGLRKGDRVSNWDAIFKALLTTSKTCNRTLSWTQAAAAILSFAPIFTTMKNVKEVFSDVQAIEPIGRVMVIVKATNVEVYQSCEQELWSTILNRVDYKNESHLKQLALLFIDVGVPSITSVSKTLSSNLPKNLVSGLKISKGGDKSVDLFTMWWRFLIAFGYSESQLTKTLTEIQQSYSASDEDALKAFEAVVVAQVLAKYHKGSINQSVLEFACQLPPHPDLLHSLVEISKRDGLDNQILLDSVFPNVLTCLLSCDKRIRASALDLLKTLLGQFDDADPSSMLDQCALINELPQDLENARNIAHRLRSLATNYKLAGTSKRGSQQVSDAVLHFFFGMLTARLQPVTTAVLELMSKLCEKDSAAVCAVAMKLIEHPSPAFDDNFVIGNDEMMDYESDVQYQILDCHTLANLQSLADDAYQNFEVLTPTLELRAQSKLKFAHYDDVRALGIKALCEIPQIAEANVISRLVPYLLQAEEEDAEEDGNDTEGENFTFKDKLALLELFSKLRHAEKLERFDEIRDRFLYFLGSRHAPLQTLGLKCLLATNTPESKVLRTYRTSFDALLDDKRFRDELVTFVSPNGDRADEGSLHADDRESVMPFVVRILYGRAQNSTKRNMRYAVLSSLHSLEPVYLNMFVDLANSHLMDSKVTGADIDFSNRAVSRKIQGYLSLIGDFMHHLRITAKSCVPTIVNNGIFPILRKLKLDDHKAVRQLVTKDIEELVSSVPTAAVWDDLYPEIHDLLVKPQLESFAAKNHENTSALMKLLLTVSSEAELSKFVDKEATMALISCLAETEVKDAVIILVLKLVQNSINLKPQSAVTAEAISETVQYLPAQLERELSVECFSIAIDTVNKIFSLGVDSFDAEVVHNIALVSFEALQKPSRLVPLPIKGSILFALSQILSSPHCSLEIIDLAYEKLAPLFRQFVASDHRLHLSACYEVFGKRRAEYARVGRLIAELNSVDPQRLGEPDFSQRSVAFEEINEQIWKDLTPQEWKPLMFNVLFFMKDPNELAFRNNGKYAVMRLIESNNAPTLVDEFVLPAIKKGLRDTDDKFRRQYIDLLGQCARSGVMPSLEVLLFKGDEEADFFINVGHVQVHRRRRAIQRLGKNAELLESSAIAHYLLTIVENFAAHSGSKNSELNNLADDALHTITLLLRRVSEGQFKSVARRCVQNVLQGPEPAKLRKSARVVTAVAQATPQGIDDFVINALVEPLHKFLSAKSNEHENLPDRVPLAVAIFYFMKALDKPTLEAKLPGKLTPLCQLLRSKIPEMRDTVRQSLGRVARILGPEYLSFVTSELSGALRKGGVQGHVLGFTMHSILVELNRPDGTTQESQMYTGGTDDSAGMIFRIVMGDTFGSVGDEKDSEGYVTAAKEVKQHKSFDTAEILAKWTSLSQFGRIIEPMREFLCSTKLSSKAEHKVEEVLRRLAAGLHRNAQAGTQDAVIMGYEIFSLCDKVLERRKVIKEEKTKQKQISGSLAAREEAAKESEEFFTVRLSSRDWYNGSEATTKREFDYDQATRYASVNLHLLQSFALDTLRSVLTSTSNGEKSESGTNLLNAANVKGLLPLIAKGLNSNFEDLNIAALRLATTALRIPITLQENDDILVICGSRVLHFIESSPDTNSLICQTSFKLLTMLIRTKPEFDVKSGAVAYILERMRPDLEEPERQGTAISFIRAIFARKIMLPQVYDVADTISKVLVTNQSEHIRINCRAAYLHFLTTYPLGQSRLDRHLAALGANFRYEAPAGRLSAMEMVHSILQKIQPSQLESAFVQYFASLVLALVSDNDADCRKKAKVLVQEIINRNTSTSILEKMIEYCSTWLGNFGKNDLLVRGGLEVANMFAEKPQAAQMMAQLRKLVREILSSGQRVSKTNIEWQLVYLALDYDISEEIDLAEGVLLFPHPWVRAKAARVFGAYFKATPKNEISGDLLVRVGYKLVRQLGAPQLPTDSGLQIVKNLVFILPLWDSEKLTMNVVRSKKDENTDYEDQLCIDWITHKLGSIVRTDVSASDLINGKTSAVQIIAAMPSILSKDTALRISYDLILSLYVLNDQLTAENVHIELRDLVQEAMSLFDEALGTTEYLKRYTQAQQFVQKRREERRAKRSIEAVTDPEAYARKKLKRNVHKHDARKQKRHNR